jgi:hypothetical protein
MLPRAATVFLPALFMRTWTAAPMTSGNNGSCPWCPCQDLSLCQPLDPQPPKNRTEVIAYPRGISGQYGQSRSDWRQYDWSKVTAVGLYDNLGNHECGCHTLEHPGDTPCNAWQAQAFPDFCCLDAELICAAHANNARVLIWDGGIGGCNGGNPSNSSFPCANTVASPIPEFLSQIKATPTVPPSHATIDAWAVKSASYVKRLGMDGVVLDIEGIVNTTQSSRDALSYGICALRQALERSIPGSMLTLTMAATPFASGVHGASLPEYGMFDIQAIDRCIDFFQPGAYCTCVGGPPPIFSGNGSALNTSSWGIPPGTLDRGNMPMAVLQNIISSYGALGIAPHRLVALMPWYGCDFSCTDALCATTSTGPSLPEPVGGAPCGFPYGPFVPDGVDLKSLPPAPTGGPGYAQVLRMKEKIVGEVVHNVEAQTKSFRWRPGTVGAPMHQVTYDDPETYATKYKWALEKQFRGVGFWMADATDGNQEAIRDMWAAVP